MCSSLYVSIYCVCGRVWSQILVEGIVSSEVGIIRGCAPMDMMLRTEIISSRRTSNALNHKAISLATCCIFKMKQTYESSHHNYDKLWIQCWSMEICLSDDRIWMWAIYSIVYLGRSHIGLFICWVLFFCFSTWGFVLVDYES